MVYNFKNTSSSKASKNTINGLYDDCKTVLYLRQPGAGTIRPDIISSLITGGSDGGGGHTSESIISSVTRIIPTRSGGSVRDDLKSRRKNVFLNYLKF